MRIFAGGILQETNTFSSIVTTLHDFEIVRGVDRQTTVDEWRLEDLEPYAAWQNQTQTAGLDFTFGFHAWAQPAGRASGDVYTTLRDGLLSALKGAPAPRIVLLNLHGAMAAVGCDDCEGDILRRVREQVGSKTIIGCLLDLHCHLTSTMLSNASLIVAYKEYPHTDIRRRGMELFELSLDAALGKSRPVMSQFDCRMMGFFPTTGEPLRTFIDHDLARSERKRAVLSASFLHGYPHGDVADSGAKVLVVADADMRVARREAEALGQKLISLRTELGFHALGLEDAMGRAVRLVTDSPGKVVVVADQSDNAGAGAPSDSTFALRWLLEHSTHNAGVAIVHDPETVDAALGAREGATIRVQLGGKRDARSGAPVECEATVLKAINDYDNLWPQDSGAPIHTDAGHIAGLRLMSRHGAHVDVVVSGRRAQCYSPAVFDDVGIASDATPILVVKSIQHFHAAFKPIATEIIYMAAPGAAPLDVRSFTYVNADTASKYPWLADPT